MVLKQRISDDLKSAMKEKNTIKLGILRVLKSEIERNEQSATGKVELTDADIFKLVKKLIDGIKETTKNQDEINYLEVYLPKQMTEEEILDVIRKLKNFGYSELSAFMKYFKSSFGGLCDGKLLSNLVKKSI